MQLFLYSPFVIYICFILLNTIECFHKFSPIGHKIQFKKLNKLRPLSLNAISSNIINLNGRCGNYFLSKDNEVSTLSFEVGGKKMSFETGKVGRQADGAVISRLGDTMLYSTICFAPSDRVLDFTPLKVDYFSRFSAVGLTSGGYSRTDGRGDQYEILTSRLIDRSIRPIIKEGWTSDTQLLTWLLSYDKVQSPEALSITTSSAALAISQVPMKGLIAGIDVGLINDNFVLNPSRQEATRSVCNLTLAGNQDGLLMIEGGANFIKEDLLQYAIEYGLEGIKIICEGLSFFQEYCGKKKLDNQLKFINPQIIDMVDNNYGKEILSTLITPNKSLRGKLLSELEKTVTNELNMTKSISEEDLEVLNKPDLLLLDDPTTTSLLDPDIEVITDSVIPSTIPLPASSPEEIKIAFHKVLSKTMSRLLYDTNRRVDGRSFDQVRPITIESDWLPGAHGSALFTRGETQTIATATLGDFTMDAKYEILDQVGYKNFYLQYRFPPSCVGEIGRAVGIGRREVGHGNLAEKALLPCIPLRSSNFTHSVRAESLITESSGSSSMATVCGCTLAMINAGVPLTSMVSGIAMGLVFPEHDPTLSPIILSDIQGVEDALGQMDFKIAGNEDGITAIQMDVKHKPVSLSLIPDILRQARVGRINILNIMKQNIPVIKHIPGLERFSTTMNINPLFRKHIIGKDGSKIKSLINDYQLINIEIALDGVLTILSDSLEKNLKAKEGIESFLLPKMNPPERNMNRNYNFPPKYSSNNNNNSSNQNNYNYTNNNYRTFSPMKFNNNTYLRNNDTQTTYSSNTSNDNSYSSDSLNSSYSSYSFPVPKEMKAKLIGLRGCNIKKLGEIYELKDIWYQDTGVLKISASSFEKCKEAEEGIKSFLFNNNIPTSNAMKNSSQLIVF